MFSELRQLLELFLGEGGVQRILDEGIKSTRYRHLSYDRVYELLRKLKELGLMTRSPPGVPKIKRKDIEALMKEIKPRLM